MLLRATYTDYLIDLDLNNLEIFGDEFVMKFFIM
jgi:hypothetical protein